MGQVSGQRLSGEQLQSSQTQLSHSQSGLLQLDTDHLLPIFGLREYVEFSPTFLFIKKILQKTTVPYEIIISFTNPHCLFMIFLSLIQGHSDLLRKILFNGSVCDSIVNDGNVSEVLSLTQRLGFVSYSCTH